MEIKCKEISEYIPKSTGYMLTLMRGQDLPLLRFARGKRVIYTTAPFGPHEDSIYDWDPDKGAQGNDRVVDTWETTFESGSKPTREILNNAIYDRFGIGVNNLRYWPAEPGRFTASRFEDGNGNEAKDGLYLADYDVRIECRPLQNLVDVGHFGLPSIDGEPLAPKTSKPGWKLAMEAASRRRQHPSRGS